MFDETKALGGLTEQPEEGRLWRVAEAAWPRVLTKKALCTGLVDRTQRLTHFFCKGPGSKYCRLLDHRSLSQLLKPAVVVGEKQHRQYINRWEWLAVFQ